MTRDQGIYSTRRSFCWTLAGALVSPRIAIAQASTAVRRIGVLCAGSEKGAAEPIQAFRSGLEELGWNQQRVVFIWRWANGRLDDLPRLAAELVELRVDLILACGFGASDAAARSIRKIPVVFPDAWDPAGDRVVAKMLEEMADSAENIAKEVLALKDRDMIRESILNEIAMFAGQVTRISEQSLKGFFTGEVNLANEAVEIVENAENDERRLAQKTSTHVKDANLAAGLRIITWNLGQIAKYSRIIGEVTINRIIEKPSEICTFLPVQ